MVGISIIVEGSDRCRGWWYFKTRANGMKACDHDIKRCLILAVECWGDLLRRS